MTLQNFRVVLTALHCHFQSVLLHFDIELAEEPAGASPYFPASALSRDVILQCRALLQLSVHRLTLSADNLA